MQGMFFSWINDIIEDPAWKIIGLGASGIPDLGYSHDREMDQVLENEIQP
jgi:hypothetical protein